MHHHYQENTVCLIICYIVYEPRMTVYKIDLGIYTSTVCAMYKLVSHILHLIPMASGIMDHELIFSFYLKKLLLCDCFTPM